jgi:hypothetical protein
MRLPTCDYWRRKATPKKRKQPQFPSATASRGVFYECRESTTPTAQKKTPLRGMTGVGAGLDLVRLYNRSDVRAAGGGQRSQQEESHSWQLLAQRLSGVLQAVNSTSGSALSTMGWGSGSVGSDGYSRFIVPVIANSHGRHHARKNGKPARTMIRPASRIVHEVFRSLSLSPATLRWSPVMAERGAVLDALMVEYEDRVRTAWASAGRTFGS